MKKIQQILCAAAIMATFCACGSKNEFTINGTIGDPAFNGSTVYLVNAGEAVDSTVVADGQFTFKGTVDQPWMGALYAMGEQVRAQLELVVEPGTISLDMLTDDLAGTRLNEQLHAFTAAATDEELDAELAAYMQAYYQAPSAAARAEAEHLYDSVEAIANSRTIDQAWQLYNGNKDNILGCYAMSIIATTRYDITFAELDSILADVPQSVRDYAPVARKYEQLKAVEATSAGHHYTDIQGVDGKLSDLIDGRLALVDFYASWCGPCRAEIRDNLVPLWAKYQKKGLVIVGLNVWERGDREAREAAHQKVMADLGITYPQLVDSTRTATDTYGVAGIPQIMLIAPDGTILARDLRGAAIEEAIVKALGK